MLRRLLEFLFGCWHEFGWPHASRYSSTGHYRACLRCGREVEADADTWALTGRCHAAPVHIPFKPGPERGWTKVVA